MIWILFQVILKLISQDNPTWTLLTTICFCPKFIPFHESLVRLRKRYLIYENIEFICWSSVQEDWSDCRTDLYDMNYFYRKMDVEIWVCALRFLEFRITEIYDNIIGEKGKYKLNIFYWIIMSARRRIYFVIVWQNCVKG